MVKERKVEGIDGLLVLATCGVLSILLSGCGMTTGWKVEFGVSPLTSKHDEAGLNTEDLRNGSRKGFETATR